MTQDQREINRKLRVLEYAKNIGNVSKARRFYGLSVKAVSLAFFIFCALIIFFSSSLALALDQPSQGLIRAKTLKCSFSLSVTVDWDEGAPNYEISDSKMNFSFTGIDLEKAKATMIGNNGTAEVSIIANDRGVTFFERTAVGNLNFTTVFYHFSQTLSGFAAVHSRHMDILGPIPSQRYGICKV